MTVSPAEKELEDQLVEAGNQLLSPPSSVDELHPLLDKVEYCLTRVEQSPSKSMLNAINLSMKALIAKELLRHTDVDVKVAVAACISEITRITAPEAPYDDDQMKEVFKLIVSSFEKLYDKSSRSYNRRALILETVAKVRSCVVMLDLECDTLIIEMFKHFFLSVRSDHPNKIFLCMETIMTLVIEESEDIPAELLSPVLECLQKNNKEVSPIAQKLGERVLGKCSSKLKPYLVQAVKSMGVSVFNYSKVVADVCGDGSDAAQPRQGNAIDKNSVAKETPAGDAPAVAAPASVGSLKTVMSSSTLQKENDEPEACEDYPKEPETDEHTDARAAVASSNTKTDSAGSGLTENLQSLKGKTIKCKGGKSVSAKNPSDSSGCAPMDVDKEAESTPDHQEGENKEGENMPCDDHDIAAEMVDPLGKEVKNIVDNVVSPKNLEDEAVDGGSGSMDVGEGKDMEMLTEEETSADPNPRKAPEAKALPETKSHKHTGKKVSSSTSNEGNTPSAEVETQETHEATTMLESKVRKTEPSADNEKSAPLVDADSKKELEASVAMKSTPSKRTARKAFLVAGKEESSQSPEDASKKDASAKSGTNTRVKRIAKVVTSGSKKKKGQGKVVEGKACAKSPSKDEGKESVSSGKSASKSTVRENAPEKTLTIKSKRKRTLEKEDASKIEDGEDLVGSKIKVHWPEDDQFYNGIIDSFDLLKKQHTVSYDDGDVEVLNLEDEKWEFLKGHSTLDRGDASDDECLDTSAKMHLKKKAKTDSASSKKQGKVDASSKPGGGASSGKAKAEQPKSVFSRPQSDVSKSAGKAEYKKGGKSKDTPKMTLKLKDDDDMKTPTASNKSEQETPKNATKYKGKASESGGKSGTKTHSSGKLKSGSSNTAKGARKTPGSANACESVKRESCVPPKSQKSGSKTSKKQSRR